MTRRSFFRTLLLGNLAMVAVIVALAFVVSYTYLAPRWAQRGLEHQAELASVLVAHFEQDWSEPPSIQTLDAEVDQFAKGLPSRITLIAQDGQVLGESQGDPLSMVNHKTPDRPEILAALAGRTGAATRVSETQGRPMHYLAFPVTVSGRVVAALRLATPADEPAPLGAYLLRALGWSALAAVAADLVLILLLSWLWSSPIRQITSVAGKLASGDLSARARLRGSRELVDLGAALNQMRLSIRRQMAMLAAEQENLRTVLSNLREGVVALDGHEHIVEMNAAAVAIFAPDSPQATGRHFQSVVRIPEVVDALADVKQRGQVSRQIQVDFRGRKLTLQLQGTHLARSDADSVQTLLMVHDITELARTAQVKSEFVANASHELRTPLATLRAAVDSMLADVNDPAAMTKFAGILDRQLRRLEEMTKDLLDLHLVERAKEKLRLERIELSSLADWARATFEAKAAQRQQDFQVSVSDGQFAFDCDRILIQLILQNLLDNALKFTPLSGRIHCQMQGKDDSVVFTVADSGCGIPPELQERVFERFFQADTSRAARGTGLGLAIVKYAAERLGAAVQLKSAPAEGTTVTVTVPCVRLR